jgi:hypothetical protein
LQDFDDGAGSKAGLYLIDLSPAGTQRLAARLAQEEGRSRLIGPGTSKGPSLSQEVAN